jgi:hypothetical protein
MPRIACRPLHLRVLVLPGVVALCGAGAAPLHATGAAPHPAIQPAAIVAAAPARPALPSTGRTPVVTADPAPVPASIPEAGPAGTPPAPVRAVLELRTVAVWATAHVLYADFVGTCVACTSTGAGYDRSYAEARGAHLLTEPASEGQGRANGESAGALVELPPNPLLHLALETWRARTTSTWTGSSGHAEASVLDLGLARPGVLDVTVARASSDAATSGQSGASARTREDALTAVAGGGVLRIVVLHAESSDHGDGSAQLASVNGIALVESGNVMIPGTITVPRTASFELLHADGDGAAAAAARDGRSQGVVGLSSGATGEGRTTPAEPLH